MDGDFSEDMLEIDGSVLEGGGQILRIAVALSAILVRPLRVVKIRAGRTKPGLSHQHMRGIELVNQMCSGQLSGCQLGSTEIQFVPGKLTGGDFVGDSVTAGSVGLLLQVALPCAIFSSGPTVLRLRGGTNADFAPPVDDTQHVFLPLLRLFGVDPKMTILRRGYYPKGGGEMVVKTNPAMKLNPIRIMERGELLSVSIFAYVAGQLPVKISEDCVNLIERQLREVPLDGNVKINRIPKKESHVEAIGTGSGAFVWAETSAGCLLAGSSCGSKTKKTQEVAAEASNMLITSLKGAVCVDEHHQDQLIIFMALADGFSQIHTGPLSLHTKTAIFVCEKITGVKFQIDPLPGGNNLVGCTGIGFQNRYLL